MKESDLRKWHRRVGITITVFILLQAGSGFLISLGGLSTPHSHAHTESVGPVGSEAREGSLWHESLEFIHHGAGAVGSVYRILLGAGILWMALTGSAIFFRMRARSQKG